MVLGWNGKGGREGGVGLDRKGDVLCFEIEVGWTDV